MSHHESELPFAESLDFIDHNVAHEVTKWRRELTTDQYKDRIRELMDDLEDCRDWVGKEGDDANRMYLLAKDHYENLD